ncbi:MAG: CRTAC1 family protein [Elusimicrobia bacterium]|nr:CRTAC1 family protein [Elusimicrobiota bacterium]
MGRGPSVLLAGLLACLASGACGPSPEADRAAGRQLLSRWRPRRSVSDLDRGAVGGPLPPAAVWGFTETALPAGIAWRHRLATPELRNIVDGVGAGAAFADLDADGWLDLILLGGPRSPEPGVSPKDHAGLAVYKNLRNGLFEDVTARTGIPPGSTAVAVAAGDVDGDGLRDVYLVDRGPNRLYRNKGGFVFEDVTKKAGVGDARFGIGAVFFDMDGDGDLDLFVANYLEYDPGERSFYAPDAYPGPAAYKAEASVLYRNRGDGVFEDVSAASGVGAAEGRAMSVAAFDADADGRTDVFVANDVTENFLWMNRGGGRFVEAGGLAGVAYGEQGERTSAMAADVGDVDGDGRPDLAVSDNAYGTLYRSTAPGRFRDIARRSGVSAVCAQHVSWGQNLIDYDNDGTLDLFIAQADLQHLNGWEPLLLKNDGRARFTDVSAEGGPPFSRRLVARSSIVGDYDNDGDEDILVTVLGDLPVLLRNDNPPKNSWITLDLVGAKARDPFGARVEVEAGGRRWAAECRDRTAYLGQSDPRLHFGLGPGVRKADRILVTWPGGGTLTLDDVPARQILAIRQDDQPAASR